jgi:hypothetical protein
MASARRTNGSTVELRGMRTTSRVGAFIALGAGVGVAIGADSHHIALGLALGVAAGLALGTLFDRQLSK